MNKPEIDYIISNGKYAIEFLQNLSYRVGSKADSNLVFNHAAAVAHLIRAVQSLYDRVNDLHIKLKEKDNTIRDLQRSIEELQRGEFDNMLQQSIDKLKDDLIYLIKEFPDNEY